MTRIALATVCGSGVKLLLGVLPTAADERRSEEQDELDTVDRSEKQTGASWQKYRKASSHLRALTNHLSCGWSEAELTGTRRPPVSHCKNCLSRD